MAIFRYRAKERRRGRLTSGKIEAPDIEVAQSVLEEKGLGIVLLEPVKPRWRIPLQLERVTARDLVIFSRQLATLVQANVSLVQALRTLARQSSNGELRRIITAVSNEVEAGTRLSLAIAKYPRVFNVFFVNMVKSGETAGRLSEVLLYLAEQTEKEYDLISKVRGAMIYPAFIVFGMVIVGVVLLVFVIPQLTGVLIESGAELPLTTRFLIWISEFVKKFWWAIALAAGLLGMLFFWALKYSEGFHTSFDKFKLRIPVAGSLFQRIYLARITRSLQILLSGGVDTVQALTVVGAVSGNRYYQRIIYETQKEVEDGNSITSVFSQSPLIPGMVSQMLAVGEETGQLTNVLEQLTNFYAREVDNAVHTLISIIEPVLMVIIGVGVGIVVAAIILPMYRLAGQF